MLRHGVRARQPVHMERLGMRAAALAALAAARPAAAGAAIGFAAALAPALCEPAKVSD